MSVVILRNQVVHYETLGRGKPVLFLHSWIGSWRYWVPAMQTASVAFRTYALDLWGFGDTAKAANYYTFGEQVALVGEFLAAMGVGRVALVGHGFGACVALQFARESLQLVDRLLLIGLPCDRKKLNGRIGTSSLTDLAEWLLNSNDMAGEAARIEALKADQLAIRQALPELVAFPLEKHFAELELPYLLVYGQSDPLVLSPAAEELSNLPPNSHWIVLEASAHFPMLEESAKFNRLLIDFLNLDPGQSPQALQLKEEWKRRVR